MFRLSICKIVACRVSAGNNAIRGEMLNVVASHYHHQHHQSQQNQQQHHITTTTKMFSTVTHRSSTRKRQFDVASLLAPDSHETDEKIISRNQRGFEKTFSVGIDDSEKRKIITDIDEDIDVEENEESDNNNRSAFDAEDYHNHKQQKLHILSSDDDAHLKTDANRSPNHAPNTDLTEFKEHSNANSQTANSKKCAQYSNICDLVESDDDVAHLTYSYSTSNDDNHLDITSNVRQHFDLNTASSAIDPRILVGRYYGQRMAAVHQNNQH